MLSLRAMAQTPIPSPTNSETNRIISYQALITEASGAPVRDGLHGATVTLYSDVNGTEQIWSGSYSGLTHGGVLNLQLGSGQYPFPTSAVMDKPLWLGI